MITLDTTKKIARLVVGVSTTFVVNNLLQNNVAPRNKFQTVELFIGSLAISQVVAAKTDALTVAAIDEFDRKVKDFKATI